MKSSVRLRFLENKATGIHEEPPEFYRTLVKSAASTPARCLYCGKKLEGMCCTSAQQVREGSP